MAEIDKALLTWWTVRPYRLPERNCSVPPGLQAESTQLNLQKDWRHYAGAVKGFATLSSDEDKGREKKRDCRLNFHAVAKLLVRFHPSCALWSEWPETGTFVSEVAEGMAVPSLVWTVWYQTTYILLLIWTEISPKAAMLKLLEKSFPVSKFWNVPVVLISCFLVEYYKALIKLSMFL